VARADGVRGRAWRQRVSGGDSEQAPRPRLLILVTEDWYFVSHRLALAKSALNAGYDVVVATRLGAYKRQIESAGLEVIDVPLTRRGVNPIREFMSIIGLVRLYRRLRPDIVHHVALKPVVYGSIAARLSGVPAVVNALGGLGFLFTSTSRRAALGRRGVVAALRVVTRRRGYRMVFQTAEDCAQFVDASVVPRSETVIIRGAGVDVAVFHPTPEPIGDVVVLLAARMLWDKGIGEFVEAVRLLKQRGITLKAVVVGILDAGNPRAIPEAQLRAWNDDGVIDWWGRRDDMPEVLASSHIVVLPTYYGEGVPKVLLEAAASARPIITTQIPGCREVVRHDVNGLLVPPKDPMVLADAIARLVGDPGLRERFGERGREIAVSEFRAEKVVEETLAVYRDLLGPRRSLPQTAVC
jgi:glycosyltransferase involved in cell wall biosynthesis